MYMATHQKKHVKNKGARVLEFKGKDQEYAHILKNNGGSPPIFDCQLLDGRSIQAFLPGRLQKKGSDYIFIKKDTKVLIEKDQCNTEKKWHIVHIYKDDEWNALAKGGHLNIIKTVNNQTTTGTLIVTQNEAEQNRRDQEVEIDDSLIDNI